MFGLWTDKHRTEDLTQGEATEFLGEPEAASYGVRNSLTGLPDNQHQRPLRRPPTAERDGKERREV
jgi:hypothetical protein